MVLGPLLFLLYINDITSNFQSENRLFADDCILYRTIINPTDCWILQDDINQLLFWATVWQMQFTSKKCHILFITKQRSQPTTTYTLGAETLSHVDSYPYLGVTVLSDLRWHNHITCITNKATRTLNFIRHNIYGCSPEAKALAYTSLVRPHLEYAASAWDSYLAVDISQLESVQRRAVRFARKDYRRSISVSGLFEHLHWLLLSAKRTDFRLVNFYKAVNNQTAISTSHLQNSRSHHAAPETQAAPHSSHSLLAQIHENTLSFHAPSMTGTSCHETSALNLQLALSGNPSPVLINNTSQPCHDAPAITGARPLLEKYWRTEDGFKLCLFK